MERRGMLLSLVGIPVALAGQSAQRSVTPRRRFVPQEVIEHYNLRPSEGYGLYVLGMDGRPYDLDDVLFAIFDMTQEHWRRWGSSAK